MTEEEILNQLMAKTDPKLCFVCQDGKPTHRMKKLDIWLGLCDLCASAIKTATERNNRVKKALNKADTTHIFQYVLGWNLLPTKVVIEKLEDRKHDNTN